MTLIGIDYSLTSPALTILKDNTYSFISLFDQGNKDFLLSKSKKLINHQLLYQSKSVELIPYQRESKTNLSYQKEAILKHKEAQWLSYTITEIIKQKTGSKCPLIGIEGFSYGSISSSTLDLALYQSFLRLKLIEEFGVENIIVIPPTVAKKKLTGKGNANKELMINSFISNSLNDPYLEETKFLRFLREQPLDFNNIKPIDDIVDSYAVLKSLVEKT